MFIFENYSRWNKSYDTFFISSFRNSVWIQMYPTISYVSENDIEWSPLSRTCWNSSRYPHKDLSLLEYYVVLTGQYLPKFTYFQGQEVRLWSFKTLLNIYQSTWCNIPECMVLQQSCCEKWNKNNNLVWENHIFDNPMKLVSMKSSFIWSWKS
jgi:hypothetical protein